MPPIKRVGLKKPTTVMRKPSGSIVTPKATKPAPAAKSPAVAVERENSNEPALYHTLSLLGLMMAAMRSRDPSVIDAAYGHLHGFMEDLQHYGISFPGMEMDRVRGHVFTQRWKEANTSLKEFSDSFAMALRKATDKDNSVKAESVSLLNTFLDMIAVRNPERWGRMETTALNKLKYLGNPILNQLWRVHIEGDQSDEMEKLKEIVEQVRGRAQKPGTDARQVYMLSFGEHEKLREDDPELNKKYNAAKNGAIKKYRAALRNWVLDKGGKPQPIPKARTAMEGKGYLLHELPQELDELFIGEDGFYYTETGNKIINRPMPGAIIGGMNPNYDPSGENERGDNWIFRYRTEEGDWTLAYADQFRRESKSEKSSKVLDNLDKVPGLRPKWLADLRGTDHNQRVLALITDLLYHFAARIGGVGNQTKGVGNTYGISTLLVSHVKKVGATYKLDYFGKSGQHQIHTINSSDKDEKRYIPLIEALMRGKKKTDPLFTFMDGKPVTAANVRAYFKHLAIPVNPHYFRSVRGTLLARDILEAPAVVKRKFEQPEGEKFFKKTAEQVGAMLGHFNKGNATGSTAISAGYIAFEYGQDWFKSKDLRVPLWLKATANDKD